MCLAVPGRLVRCFEANSLPMGHVEFAGIGRDVCLAYVPEAVVGDYVIVHVGFALSVLDAEEAERTLAVLDELGALADRDPGEQGSES